jgi:hypothetical protein
MVITPKAQMPDSILPNLAVTIVFTHFRAIPVATWQSFHISLAERRTSAALLLTQAT